MKIFKTLNKTNKWNKFKTQNKSIKFTNLKFNNFNQTRFIANSIHERKKTGLLKGEDVITTDGMSKEKVEEILDVGVLMQKLVENEGATDMLKGKVLGNVFFEPSTRTASSYYSAMLRLGGTVLPLAAESSSHQKGETLADTVRVFQNYIDALVLRHPQKGAAKIATENSNIPVINAGDGPGEHPTQSLLDLLCIRSEMGRLEGITVTMVGDLKYGRTVHSFCKVLKHWNMKLNLVSPTSLKMPQYILDDYLKDTPVVETQDLKSVMKETDILYVTRVQKERFEDLKEYEKVKDAYIVDKDMISGAKEGMLIMHPLPRVNEISTDVDSYRGSIYFKQVAYGMYLRMALLAGVLGAL